ncbi:MAG: hypothetical protein JKY33_06555 [Bacteroidia bacterium]|nr:hypothetical protein [Bacteroidia bacterium]
MSIKESNISAKLEELRQLLTKIESSSDDQFTSIDIDLLLSKTQDLYENFLSLKAPLKYILQLKPTLIVKLFLKKIHQKR